MSLPDRLVAARRPRSGATGAGRWRGRLDRRRRRPRCGAGPRGDRPRPRGRRRPGRRPQRRSRARPAATRSSSPPSSAPGGWSPPTIPGRSTSPRCAAPRSRPTWRRATSRSAQSPSRSPGASRSTPTAASPISSADSCARSAPRSFADDPLRLLRAARLAAELDLDVDPGTLTLARAEAGSAAEPAGERQLAELRQLLGGPDPLRGLELLDELGLTAVVLPEVEELRGVEQGPNHHLDVHGHTLAVLEHLLEVESDLERFAGERAAEVAGLLAEPLADEMTRADRAALRRSLPRHRQAGDQGGEGRLRHLHRPRPRRRRDRRRDLRSAAREPAAHPRTCGR